MVVPPIVAVHNPTVDFGTNRTLLVGINMTSDGCTISSMILDQWFQQHVAHCIDNADWGTFGDRC